MTQTPVVRLHLYFARNAPLAVIVRQGPTRQYRMILWDRSDDTFTDGQWLRKNLYPERCAISPDGRHFLYFMLDGQWGSDAEGAYTVISRPPYWTAVALFPEGSTWGGGGVFLDDRHYLAAGDADIIGRDDGLVRLHWGDTGQGCTTGLRRPDNSPAPLDKTTVARLLSGDLPADHRDLGRRLWDRADRPLDRYDTQGGCLYRRAGGEMELIRDFTRMTFEPIRAPYDWRDETGREPDRPWHPLDGDDG